MSSDTQKVKELRDRTGLSFGEIKKALDEASGDMDRALQLLAERGAVVAAKKASRSTQEGLVKAYIHSTGKIGAMVKLLCETDFVARNPLFSELAHDLAMQIAATAPETPEALLSQEFIKDSGITIQELINQYIAKIGENIQLGEFVRFQI